MPDVNDVGISWAAEVEAETTLPDRTEVINGNLKTVTEYKLGDNDERIKVVSQYRIETKQVPRSVAQRKAWKKFGKSSDDPSGPNIATTFMSDDVSLQFVRNSAGDELDIREQDDTLSKLKSKNQLFVCQICKMPDHLTVRCPYKSLMDEQRAALDNDADPSVLASVRQKEAEDKMKAGTYVPPSMRGTGARPSAVESRRDDWTVRVTNLPEDTTDEDLRELFKQAGKVQRIFLAKDKQTNRSKGFAFITYQYREDAERAIQLVSGHRYDHLILKVEWARPNVT